MAALHNAVRVDDAWLRATLERERASARHAKDNDDEADGRKCWRGVWALKPLTRQVADRFQAYCRAIPPNDDFVELPRRRFLRVIAAGRTYEFATEDAITDFLRRQPTSLVDGDLIEDVAAFGDPEPLAEYYALVSHVQERRIVPDRTTADATTEGGGVKADEKADDKAVEGAGDKASRAAAAALALAAAAQHDAALADPHKRFENTVVDTYEFRDQPPSGSKGSAGPKVRFEIVTRGVCRGYALSAAFDNEFEIAAVADTLEECLRGVGLINKIVFSTPFLLGRTAELAVLKEYMTLTGLQPPRAGHNAGPQDGGGRQRPAAALADSADASLEELQKAAKSLMVGPKAVTLEQRHVTPPNSVFDGGYAMCDKTDGERALLFVSSSGHAFLIGAGLRVRATGIVYKDAALHSSLLDGEHVAPRRQPLPSGEHVAPRSERMQPLPSGEHEAAMLYMMFDAYFVGGKDVRTSNLPERLDKCNLFEAADGGLKVASKTFYGLAKDADEATMREACAEVLAKAKTEGPSGFPYHTDGLIFTPIHLPVAALKTAILKWKPPEQNTIDFLVEQSGAHFTGPDGGTYAAFTLMTGFNEASGDFGKIFDVLSKLYTDSRQAPNRDTNVNFYGKRPFQPTAFYAHNAHKAMVRVVNGLPTCEDGSPVRDNTIVEFAYDTTGEEDEGRVASYNWRPLRCREDKTLEYTNTGRIGGAANDYRTALSVWKSIHMPVSESMLRGETKVDADLTNYYEDVGDRRESANRHMLDFHNRVKEALYMDAAARLPPARRAAGPTIAELACGKAGDLFKWLKAGFTTVFAVDSNRDCIMNGVNGAYRRLMNVRGNHAPPGQEWRRWNPAKTTVVFAVVDASERFAGVGAEADPESGLLLDVVMGRKAAGASAYLAKLHNKGNGNGGFDVVSTQFAVHYMFASPDKARAFMQNVAQLLRPGGLFIGTCMDGRRVDALLEESPSGTSRGTAGQSPNLSTIWEITKGYETFKTYGTIVNVFLERTGHTIPEPLIDFEAFVALAKDYGLALVESNNFEDLYTSGGHAAELDAPLSADEERFSFLNRTFTFQKKSGVDAEKKGGMVAPKSLAELAAEKAIEEQLKADAIRDAGPVKSILIDKRLTVTNVEGGGGSGESHTSEGAAGESTEDDAEVEAEMET